MKCKKEENLRYCNCSYPECTRKGICCECVIYHRNKGQIPACFFPDEIEKTFDRSRKTFVKLNS